MRFGKAFGIFFLLSFGGGAVTYSLLAVVAEQVLGEPWVFGVLNRMFTYHRKHPFQYIALVATLYSFFASVWATFWSHAAGPRRWLQITLVLGITLFVSCVLGGVLWKFHDMQAGFFPERSRLLADFLWGAKTGFEVGPIIVLLSIPMNILALIAGYVVTNRVPIYLDARDRATSSASAAP